MSAGARLHVDSTQPSGGNPHGNDALSHPSGGRAWPAFLWQPHNNSLMKVPGRSRHFTRVRDTVMRLLWGAMAAVARARILMLPRNVHGAFRWDCHGD